MQVKFSEIPDDGLRLEITDEAWFPDHELERIKAVTVSLFMKKKGDRVLLDGTIDTQLKLLCDRCLDPYDHPVHLSFNIEFELLGENQTSPPVGDHVCSASEMDMVFLQAPIIDIYQILQQQIYLALPVKKICTQSCKGLCNRCGANLNSKNCNCKPNASSSPFDVLASLKKV